MGRRTLLLVTALIGGTAIGCGGPAEEATNPDKDKAALERFEAASDGAADMGGSKSSSDVAGK